MSFVISKILWTLAAPGNLLALLLGLGVVAGRLGWRWGRTLVAVATAGFLAFLILPVGDWLVAPLENRFVLPEPVPDRVDGIILLGGFVNPALSQAHGQPALNLAADRLTAFVGLARRYPDARLIFTGGSPVPQDPAAGEVPPVRAALAELGIDPARVRFEAAARNTWENAILSRPLAELVPGQTWLLVTSAMHMPRAVGVFRQIGWPVLAWPVDYRTLPHPGWFLRLDLDWGLSLAQDGLKEWIGLLLYRLAGRTGVLLPAP